jgi:hypothetical protein
MTQPDIFSENVPWAEWLPELRVLLRAYNAVPRAERFVDTEDTPSPAMRSYLRMATYFPGRASRATADILNVLRHGLDDERVQRDVPKMCPITPPPGRTVEDCLAAMVPHLVAFTNGGEQAEPATPETIWEWRERFPNLSAMFLGWFHQDAPGSEDEALRSYAEHEPAHEVAAAARELAGLRELCGENEELLGTAVVALGTEQLPADGQPFALWLDDVALRLALQLDVRGYERPAGGPDPAYPLHDVRSAPAIPDRPGGPS